MHTHRCPLARLAVLPSLPQHRQQRTSIQGPELPAEESSCLDPRQPGRSRGWTESPGWVSERGGQEPKPNAPHGAGGGGRGSWHRAEVAPGPPSSN